MDGFCGIFDPIVVNAKALPVKQDEEHLSPFVAYQDNYRWPDLYTEIDEMIEASVLIYPLAELRQKARKGELESDVHAKDAVKLPLTHAQVLNIVKANKNSLLKFHKGFYQEILETIVERSLKNSSVTPSEIVAVDDEFQTEELVYMVDVCHNRKRITICFRGTVTPTDWATNVEVYMKEVENPLKDHSSQEPVVRVHNGFYDYLFSPSSRGATGPKGEHLCEYQEILQEHILPVIEQYPGYKVYVTGHSLGGALGTLLAFELAAAPDNVIPKPVSLFSIASPYVGDASFRAAHQLLERQGKLRHLRLTNHKDAVTLVPKFSFRWNIFDRSSSVGSLFKHVGVNLRLFSGSDAFELSYPKVVSGTFSGFLNEFARGWDQSLLSNLTLWPSSYWTYHGLREYAARLAENKPSIEAMNLNELYARPDVVGKLVPQF